jgi:hypothetical protein
VLWNMLFSMGLKIDGYVGAITTWALFAAWAGFTIAILVTMEGLSAFFAHFAFTLVRKRMIFFNRIHLTFLGWNS